MTGKACLHSVEDISFTKHSDLLCKSSIVKKRQKFFVFQNNTFLQSPQDYFINQNVLCYKTKAQSLWFRLWKLTSLFSNISRFWVWQRQEGRIHSDSIILDLEHNGSTTFICAMHTWFRPGAFCLTALIFLKEDNSQKLFSWHLL